MPKALDNITLSELSEKGKGFDLVVGIPSYNNATTIEHVVRVSAEGLKEYFGGNGMILNSDGGSSDGTQERFMGVNTGQVEKISFAYRGVPGKGSALRAILEAARELDAKAVVLLDSDLRSVAPWWLQRLASPILEQGASYVTPYYLRHKYDGTITNHICYPLTSTLYGKKIRQPIGGDFGISRDMVERYLIESEETWQSDVARFGIDIWFTTLALCEGSGDVYQAALGAKIHDVKDPGKELGPMFSQVVGTLFALMEKYQERWLELDHTIETAPIYGTLPDMRPEPVNVDIENLKNVARAGISENWSFIENVLDDELCEELKSSRESGEIQTTIWTKIVFSYACLYRNRDLRKHLIKSLIPLYFARVAAFVSETTCFSDEEAEAVIEKQLELFKDSLEYLRERWRR
ncbi:MAG TPA: glycosyltransferase [Mesotoga infera]|nr:glycosyltransferase [Mesotoga infera]HPD38810.1 glycosyltransferase [Mesotoga infera]HRR45009.1 glycosyltransferase [Mesotoga sp.]HRV02497.1 glycosyltransferase [Mesotoga sp.]